MIDICKCGEIITHTLNDDVQVCKQCNEVHFKKIKNVKSKNVFRQK